MLGHTVMVGSPMRAVVLLALLSVLILPCSFSEASPLQSTELFRSGSQVPADLLDSIPGRQALKLALLTMGRSDLSQAQRLQLAEPLFQQAIGASEEIDINHENDNLRNLARVASESSEAEKEQLGPRAVELLESIKQPIQARLLFAVALQNTAAELNDNLLNQRAVKLLQSIESKDPGAKLDVAVQGCLSICRKQPIRRINDEEALSLGQIEVEKNKDRKQEASEVDWQRTAGSAGELLLGMMFCWGISFLLKMVIKMFRQKRVHS